MNSVSININLPNCGSYSKEELTSMLQRFALYIIRPKEKEAPCCYTDEEIKAIIAARLDSFESGEAELISNEEVFAQARMLLQ